MKGPPRPRPTPPGRKHWGSGRGGARTAGPDKKNGAPSKTPSERTIVKGPYRLPPDVVEILGAQQLGKTTAYIVEAIRAYATNQVVADLELETSIANCRCGQDYVIVNDFGYCPSGCDRSAAKVSEPEGMTIPDER